MPNLFNTTKAVCATLAMVGLVLPASADLQYRMPIVGLQASQPVSPGEPDPDPTSPELSPAPAFSLVLAGRTLPSARVGRSYSFDLAPLLTISGDDPLPDLLDTQWTAQGLPAGLSLSQDGWLSGTPEAASAAVSVTVRASLAGGQANYSYPLRVAPDQLFDAIEVSTENTGASVAWLNGTFFTARNYIPTQGLTTKYYIYASTDRESWVKLVESSPWAAFIPTLRGAGDFLYAHVGTNEFSTIAFAFENGALVSRSMSGLVAPTSTRGVAHNDLPVYQEGLGYAHLVADYSKTTGAARIIAHSSADGLNWTQRAARSITQGTSLGGTLIATPIGFVTTSGSDGKFWFSATGATWQERSSAKWPTGEGTWDGSRIVMTVPGQSKLAISTDFLSATEIPAPIVANKISYGDGVYVISNATQMAYSTDLDSWEIETSADFAHHSHDGQGNWIFSSYRQRNLRFNTAPMD